MQLSCPPWPGLEALCLALLCWLLSGSCAAKLRMTPPALLCFLGAATLEVAQESPNSLLR